MGDGGSILITEHSMQLPFEIKNCKKRRNTVVISGGKGQVEVDPNSSCSIGTSTRPGGSCEEKKLDLYLNLNSFGFF